jgi:hypothetical protein
MLFGDLSGTAEAVPFPKTLFMNNYVESIASQLANLLDGQFDD